MCCFRKALHCYITSLVILVSCIVGIGVLSAFIHQSRCSIVAYTHRSCYEYEGWLYLEQFATIKTSAGVNQTGFINCGKVLHCDTSPCSRMSAATTGYCDIYSENLYIIDILPHTSYILGIIALISTSLFTSVITCFAIDNIRLYEQRQLDNDEYNHKMKALRTKNYGATGAV